MICLSALAFFSAEAVTAPRAADERVVREWVTRAATEAKVRAARTVTRKTPVRFATRHPSSYRASRVIERTLEGDQVVELRRVLELESADLSPGLCRTLPCTSDTSDLSSTRFSLGKGSKTLRIEVLLARGGARMYAGDAFWTCYHFRDGGNAVKEFLVRLFPEDPSLSASRTCTEPTAATAFDTLQDAPTYVEKLPQVLSKVTPEYPFKSEALGKSGTVLLNALVDKDGSVRETAIAGAVSEDLDAAAVRAVEQWRFKPATSDGRPLAVWVTVPVRFTVEEKKSPGR